MNKDRTLRYASGFFWRGCVHRHARFNCRQKACRYIHMAERPKAKQAVRQIILLATIQAAHNALSSNCVRIRRTYLHAPWMVDVDLESKARSPVKSSRDGQQSSTRSLWGFLIVWISTRWLEMRKYWFREVALKSWTAAVEPARTRQMSVLAGICSAKVRSRMRCYGIFGPMA